MADSGRLLGLFALVAALAATLVLGCGSSGESAGTDDPSNPSGGFESDDPSYQAGSRDGTGGGASADAGSATGGSGGSAGSNSGEDGEAERAIEEADIIQLSNGRLYALSQYSGLSVIDVSVRDQLRMLGRFRSTAMPFEMIVRGTTVIAMFSSYPIWTYDPSTGSYGYDQTSRILVLDTSNPAAITEIGAFDIPGEISDSRVVGDIFYVVSYENGYCYQCENTPTTTILSLNVADPAHIKQVDRESFAEESSSYGWGRRSIAVNQDRILVAGVEWNWQSNEGHSTIQVVDISDPAGAMVLGAKVEVEGQIESRWQMDEYEGTLRVISQEGSAWGSGLVPAVETFEIVSSHEINPLGRLEMVLPRPENLRSVRFDGERAFAVTFEQTDPLFIIDLSDPANPAQVGELEMPGWLYHMVPRGDRLLALGFDQGAADGAMAVSLFDISDLTKPTMIDRVNFGGDWVSMAEDQDRIHKAFNILDDQGLILVPYSGWSYHQYEYYCGRYHSGIQLVDFTNDSLTKRGVAAQHGTARRAFLHDQRLFAVSDSSVSTFDIADKDAPAPKARLALSHNAVKAQVVGDYLVRIEGDWWTDSGLLSVVPVADPERDQPLGTLDLSALSDAADGCYWSYWGFVYGSTVLAVDSYAVLLWNNSYYYGYGGGDGRTGMAVIDLADPTNPKLVSHKTFDFAFGGWGGYYYGGYGYDTAVMSPGAEYVQIGSTIVLQERPPYNYYDDESTIQPYKLHVLDLSDPKNPSLAATVNLPDALGHTPLQSQGNVVLTSHWESVPNNPGKVRFYVDRIDVTNPSAPQILAPINVPGSLIARHQASGRITTVDYTREVLPVTDSSACYEAYGRGARWNWQDETCVMMHRTLKLVDVQGAQATLRDSLPLDDGNYGQVALGDERIFLVRYGYSYYGYDQGDLRDKLMTLSGMGGGELVLSAPVPLADSYYSWSTLVPHGKRVVALGSYPGSVAVFDTTDTLAAPTLVKSEELVGYLYDVTLHGDQAICSLGSFGVQSVSLTD